jgi:hypothetical protein
MVEVMGRMLSRGHAERFDGIVWVDQGSRQAWDEGVDMPDGAVLVEEAIDRVDGKDHKAGFLVMEKHAGVWRFALADARGHGVSATTDTACAGCHRDAPRDFVFRVAGSPATSGSVRSSPLPSGVR